MPHGKLVDLDVTNHYPYTANHHVLRNNNVLTQSQRQHDEPLQNYDLAIKLLLHNIMQDEHACRPTLLHDERLTLMVQEWKMQPMLSINLVEYVVEIVVEHPH
jgi:hypothetical protein